jgi:hypothetical protein
MYHEVSCNRLSFTSLYVCYFGIWNNIHMVVENKLNTASAEEALFDSAAIAVGVRLVEGEGIAMDNGYSRVLRGVITTTKKKHYFETTYRVDILISPANSVKNAQ